MPPDTPQVPRRPLTGTLKDSQPPSPYRSRVRVLLGLPNSSAVPLASAISLPVVDLPYVDAQIGITRPAPESWRGSQWAESELDTLDNQDATGVETLLIDSSQHLPRHEHSELSPSARQNDLDSQASYDRSLGSSKSEGMSPVTELPSPDTNRVRETLEAESMNPENPLSGFRSTSQKTSISIPGITQPPAFSSPPSSLDSDSSLMDDENLTEQTAMPYRQPTVSSSESSSAVLAGDSTLGSAASPSPGKVAQTERGVEPEGELMDSAKLSSVDEEAPTNDNGTGLSLGKQTAHFSDLQRKVDHNPAAPGLTHPAAAGDLTSQAETLDFKPNPSKDNQITQASASGSQTALNLTTTQSHASSSQPVVNSSPRVESLPPVLTNRMALTPEPVAKTPIASLAVPTQTAIQGGEVAKSRYQTAHQMAAQIEKLERTVADLLSQAAAQKDFQQPVSPTFPQVSQPQVIIQRSASQPRAPRAFWERSYVSRLYRWSRS